jgi:hypothetical protein
MENLPKPYEREIIYVSSESQYDDVLNDNEIKLLRKEKKLLVLNYSKAETYFENEFRILGEERLKPGNFFLLSPFDNNTYVDSNNARVLLALEKASLTINFCHLLGVKSVKIVDIHMVSNEKELTISAKGENRITSQGASANINFNEIKKINNQLDFTMQSHGSSANIDEASLFLKKSRLDTDPFLKNLHDIVRNVYISNNSNKLTKITRKISLSQSIKKNLSIVANINTGLLSIDAEVKTKLKEDIDIIMDIELEF